MKSTVQTLVNHLKEHQLKIALAESMTCGLATHHLGTMGCTADVLSGSIVCYNEVVKTSILKIKKPLIKKFTAESQEVTDALARNLSKIIPADVHAALTGLAAPGGSESDSKPVGTVFYSLVFENRLCKMKKKFKGTPLQIKEKACGQFFKFIYKELKKQKPVKNGGQERT